MVRPTRGILAALWLGLAMTAASEAAAQRGEDTIPRPYILPGLGVHIGEPQKASFAAGVVLGEDWQRGGRDRSRSVALFAEPGLAAGRVSVAYFTHGFGTFGSGYGVAATVLRTWKQPWVVSTNQSYVGAEVILWPVVFLGPRIGVFRDVSTTSAGKRWFVSFDLGLGL